jgi:lincosamide nucleotidyltransferase A/C/D/E
MRAGRGREPQMDMSAGEVARILCALEAAGLSVWVDGGWAIDAVVGEQTRPHDDLDLVALLDEIPALECELAALGYERAGGAPPCSFESVTADGRQVDVHPVTAGGEYRLREGGTWLYPVDGFQGSGTIGGRAVRCLTVEAQLVCRTGYDPVDPDRHRRDVALLESLRR